MAETLAAGKRSQDILADLIKHQQLLIDCPSQVYRRIQIKMALGNSLDVRKFISLKIGGDDQGDDIQKGFVNQKDKPDKAISEHHTDITCLSKPSELLIEARLPEALCDAINNTASEPAFDMIVAISSALGALCLNEVGF
ncbi:hypothetical protein Pst134EB_014841 [Puccinia striiformis f. sp. tritici]|nr:hypothetical protein Pst134EB_014841 [Puccinia striiformis f. sp. tritici]